VLFGFDHSYGFPVGFFETLTGRHLVNWDQLLHLIGWGSSDIPALGDTTALDDKARARYTHDSVAQGALQWIKDAFTGTVLPRVWASAVNQRIAKCIPGHLVGGPFWDPNFHDQLTKPSSSPREGWKDRRLVEAYCQQWQRKSMKSIYQIGGNGSVGLQALFGISYLRQLLLYCQRKEVPIFRWPFDGWAPDSESHVLVEVYPTLYNSGLRSDEEDAKSCVTWIREHDEQGGLWGQPPMLRDEEMRIAQLEGWVPGVR